MPRPIQRSTTPIARSMTPIARSGPIKKQGKRAYRPRGPRVIGLCRYKGPNCVAAFVPTKLTNDHVIPRSMYPGPRRDDPINIVNDVCYPCNTDRGSGYKPPWMSIPERKREFVLAEKGERWARRYFAWLTPPSPEMAR